MASKPATGKTLTAATKTSNSAQKLANPGTPAPHRAAVMKKAEATGMILEKPPSWWISRVWVRS